MPWYSLGNFRTQGLLIGVASLSISVLAILLVQDVWRSTRNTLIGEARQQCAAAVTEMQRELTNRQSVGDGIPRQADFAAEDRSLQRLSATALGSYRDIEGGFLLGPERRMAGHRGGSFNLSDNGDLENEAQLVLSVARGAAASGHIAIATTEDGNDLLVGCAIATSRDDIGWVLKRLSDANDPVAQKRRWWLAGLVVAAVLGLAMVLRVNSHLQRGIQTVNAGLAVLEKDFDYRLPTVSGEFGAVAHAINQMAERRSSLESTLRRQDRLAALGRVVAGVAHEIRNPLNSLRLTLELLDRRARKDERTYDEVGHATEEVDRLDHIVARLLAFGRPGFHDRRIQDVQPLIERAVRLVNERGEPKQVTIVLEETAEKPLLADVDALAMEQILINLLVNATDAADPSSSITIGTFTHDDKLHIEVTNEGPGIQPNDRDRIFDPYFTTKENGTGLGLAISREIASLHGGSLEFTSDDRITTFVLQLPFQRGAV